MTSTGLRVLGGKMSNTPIDPAVEIVTTQSILARVAFYE